MRWTRDQRGFTLPEMLVVVVAAALMLAMATALSLSAVGRERARSAAHQLQAYMQMARVEALGRNRECRLFVHVGERRVVVADGMGTPTLVDDQILLDTTLSPSLEFATPDGSDALTLSDLGLGWFATTFAPDGTVTAGDGVMVLKGAGESYGRLSVFAAGATQVTVWNGSAWSTYGS